MMTAASEAITPAKELEWEKAEINRKKTRHPKKLIGIFPVDLSVKPCTGVIALLKERNLKDDSSNLNFYVTREMKKNKELTGKNLKGIRSWRKWR
jgi:hypothetical protein